MHKFKIKLAILLMAFFAGLVSYYAYHFVFNNFANEKILETKPATDNSMLEANSLYSIEPCRETINSVEIPFSQKKKTNDHIGGEGAFPVGGVNSLVLCGTLPEYSDSIRDEISGVVNIRVAISKSGKVLQATLINEHSSLKETFLQAAFQTRFKPFLGRTGVPVNVTGILSYEFSNRYGVRLYKPIKF